MSNESRLLGIMKKAAVEAVDANKPMEYVIGMVEAAPPKLAIRLSQKLLLTNEFLILTRNVIDFETELSFDDPDILQKNYGLEYAYFRIIIIGEALIRRKNKSQNNYI